MRRAQAICLLYQGVSVEELVQAGYGEARTVNTWIERYQRNPSIDSLKDLHRSGRPPVYEGPVRQQVIAFVCQHPGEFGFRGLTHWSLREVAALMPSILGQEFEMSHETIHRILQSNVLKPHRVSYYLNRTDPDFEEKARGIIRLYERHRQAPEDFDLLCIDELSGIQALERRHPSLPMRPGLVERREFEYIRHGTRCLMAAFDPGSGYVYGRVYPDRKGMTFRCFLDEVARWRSENELHIVMDNLNTHKGSLIREWLEGQGERVHIHYTPFHGSWLNLVESWFSVLTSKCIRRGDFADQEDLELKLMNFIDLWNYFFAHPFEWTFTEDRFNDWYEERQASLRLAI